MAEGRLKLDYQNYLIGVRNKNKGKLTKDTLSYAQWKDRRKSKPKAKKYVTKRTKDTAKQLGKSLTYKEIKKLRGK
jgi:hypothetical protein